MKFGASQKLLIFLYACVILLFFHHFIFRPIILNWGATEKIRMAYFSGDSLTSGSHYTRAILVNATPEQIWPWLLQVGQDRGGFYSYQWLENLFGARMKNVYDLKRSYQVARMPGDTIWLAARSHYNGKGFQIVAQDIPYSSLVMVGGDDYARLRNGQKARGSWAFYLYPVDRSHTWLVARSSDGKIDTGDKLLRYFFFEVPHFIMERRMLKTMKHLAEEKKEEVNVIQNKKTLYHE